MEPVAAVSNEAIALADKVEHLGVIGILTLVAVGFAWLFMKELRKNEALNSQIAGTGREVSAALTSMDKGLEAFTKTLDSVAAYIKELEEAVKDLKRGRD